ncbi:hypothetical protein KNE206_54760 [Kitasatospora sp. NE20-6]
MLDALRDEEAPSIRTRDGRQRLGDQAAGRRHNSELLSSSLAETLPLRHAPARRGSWLGRGCYEFRYFIKARRRSCLRPATAAAGRATGVDGRTAPPSRQ